MRYKHVKPVRISKGFTLIEMLVSIMVFSIAFVLVGSVVLYVTSVKRSIQAKDQVRRELASFFDVLGREITWGTAFPTNCATGCPGLNPEMVFLARIRPDSLQKVIGYKYDSVAKQILKKEQKTFGPCNTRIFPPDLLPNSCYAPVTSNQVIVDFFNVYIANLNEGVTQTTVTVVANGHIDVGGSPEPFNISSSYTPRFPSNQGALSPTLVTPVLISWQACSAGAGSDNITIQWTDDATHWMHIERRCDSCAGPPPFAPLTEKDSRIFYKHTDSPPGPLPYTYSYRVQLHDHINDPSFFDPGPYSNTVTRTVTVLKICTGGGGPGVRPIIPSPPGGDDDGSHGDGGPL